MRSHVLSTHRLGRLSGNVFKLATFFTERHSAHWFHKASTLAPTDPTSAFLVSSGELSIYPKTGLRLQRRVPSACSQIKHSICSPIGHESHHLPYKWKKKQHVRLVSPPPSQHHNTLLLLQYLLQGNCDTWRIYLHEKWASEIEITFWMGRGYSPPLICFMNYKI